MSDQPTLAGVPSEGTDLPTICVLCSHNCGIRVDVRDHHRAGLDRRERGRKRRLDGPIHISRRGHPNLRGCFFLLLAIPTPVLLGHGRIVELPSTHASPKPD